MQNVLSLAAALLLLLPSCDGTLGDGARVLDLLEGGDRATYG
jgi:hypothetical protein